MDWFPSYTQCSSPSGWYKVPAWAMALLGTVGLPGLFLAGLAGAWAPGVAAFNAPTGVFNPHQHPELVRHMSIVE